MKNVLQKKKIINSKRQPKNLRGFLSSSKFDFHESSPSVKKCTDKRCMTCPSLIEGTLFTIKNGRTFTVMQDISCKTCINFIQREYFEMSSRTIMEMFISSYYSKILVPCLLSVNSHLSPQFSFGFTYIEFSTIRANNCVYKIQHRGVERYATTRT
jgi:hypothetical protein